LDFSLTQDQEMFRDMLRGFVLKEIEPYAQVWDETNEFPYETMKKMADVGICGVRFPEEFGGSDGGEMSFVIAVEGISRSSGGLGIIYTVSLGLAMYPITLYGNQEQNAAYIPKIVGGGIAAFGLTEASAGSDVAALATEYKKRDGHYVLNGTKIFITNGAEADFALVFATKDRTQGHRGISAFVVDRGTPGFSVGKHEKKMGIHPASATELLFDECEIPESNLIGKEGEGFKIAMRSIDAGRVSVAAQAVGIAQAAFDAAVDYSKERVQFGKELARMQAIQWMIADMATDIDASRLLTYRVAWLADNSGEYIKESAMAKLFASEASHRVCYKAQQIFGGYGYIKDFPVERYVRDQRITEIYEGTSEMQRWTIARQVLGVK